MNYNKHYGQLDPYVKQVHHDLTFFHGYNFD